jgi:formylglycine-generating enzyme
MLAVGAVLVVGCSAPRRDVRPPVPVLPAPVPVQPPATAPAETVSAPLPEAVPAPFDPCAAVPADMACVPAGEMTRGIDVDPHRCAQGGQPAQSASVPSARIWLDAFFIDKTEVTVAAYRECVAAGACRDVRPFYSDFDAPDQPMTAMSWYDADAYCRQRGRRLPTESEWEKAARGPDGELGPYGAATLDCERAVVKDARGRSCGIAKRGGEPDVGRVLPVGSRPAGRYGLFDMAGNAEEWVADWWSDSYAACGAECVGKNPKGPCGGGAAPCAQHVYKVVRGGSWYWEGEHAAGYHRRRHFPANEPPAYHHFGFRCAMDGPVAP